MSIKTREDANEYYRRVNELVDEYISRIEKTGGRIRPSELREIMRPNGDHSRKFIRWAKLEEVDGIDIILNDVVMDRYYMEKDGILTFESFNFLESEDFKIASMAQCLKKGIGPANIEMEKKIADHFNTNLGEIDVVDPDRHIFSVNSWHGEEKVVVYSKDEVSIIKGNIMNYLYDELCSKKIDLTQTVSIELSDLINKDSFKYKVTKMLTDDLTIRLITDCLFGFRFEAEANGHFIWVDSE